MWYLHMQHVKAESLVRFSVEEVKHMLDLEQDDCPTPGDSKPDENSA